MGIKGDAKDRASNFRIYKRTTLFMVLIIIVWALLIVGMAFSWYRIRDDTRDTGDSVVNLYAPKIVFLVYPPNGGEVHESDVKWSNYDLKRTHNIINACLAFSILAWLVCLATIVTIILIQCEAQFIKNLPDPLTPFLLAKILMGVATVFILLSVVILGGITNAFKNDIKNTDNPNRLFVFCFDGCDDRFAGTNGEGVKFGPGIGWIITLIALFVSIVTAIFPWVYYDDDWVGGGGVSSPPTV